MNPPRWRSQARQRLRRAGTVLAEFFSPIIEVLRIPPPATQQLLQRIEIMERHIVLPIKLAGIAILLQFYFTPWMRYVDEKLKILEVAVDLPRYLLWIYIAANVVAAVVLFRMRRLPPKLLEYTVFMMCLIDCIFLGVLTLVTGGYNSSLYWLFLGLIVRAAVSVPRAVSQLVLNATLSACYVLAGVTDSYVAARLSETASGETERRALELDAGPAESLLLRIVLLLLMTFCCYAAQVLLERQRQALEEAREMAMREGQLRSAGRLAAEFAHQIKNPLAIINNAAFSLRRCLKDGRGDAREQVEMIQEEVDRADRIITQVMGYAQVSEGHVEKLDVVEELEYAVRSVFPPAAHYPVRVHQDCAGAFPPLLMQRRHASEAFINVLQNAREALGEKGGHVWITAAAREDQSIEVVIRDDGPGIAPDKHSAIFEAYYTTKEKGTGLGLATVKHTLELYGGSIRVESGLGKGAVFILSFPAKSLMKLTIKT